MTFLVPLLTLPRRLVDGWQRDCEQEIFVGGVVDRPTAAEVNHEAHFLVRHNRSFGCRFLLVSVETIL